MDHANPKVSTATTVLITVVHLQVLSRSHVAVAVMQESMRLQPSVKVLHRIATKPATVGNVQVPAGTSVAVAISAVRLLLTHAFYAIVVLSTVATPEFVPLQIVYWYLDT